MLINRTLSGLQNPAMSSRKFGIELHRKRGEFWSRAMYLVTILDCFEDIS
jgi:hypothetical protein